MRRIVSSLFIVALFSGAGIPHAGAGQSDPSEFPVPTANALLQGIVAGPDGNLWFAERNANAIGRVTPDGAVTEFGLPNPGAAPFWLTVGSDAALWFTEISGNRIGRITTGGTITEFDLPTASSQPTGIAAGPDGALWFTERTGNAIGRITTAGVVTEYPLPRAASGPWGIAAGPDGALWFTENTGNRIGRMTTDGSVTNEWAFSFANRLAAGITAGPDGAMWFTERQGTAIGQIAGDGTITEWVLTSGANPVAITAGPDDALWFTELGGNAIGRITTDGVLSETAVPTAASQPYGIAAGPGGIWFTEAAGNAVVLVPLSTVSPDTTAPTVTIASPMDGSVVMRGSTLLANYACADEEGGSGLVSCDGPVPSSSALDTSALGAQVVTVEAGDAAGNVGTASVGYLVVEGMTGPFAAAPAWTTLKAGTNATLGLNLGVAAGKDAITSGYPMSVPVSCTDPTVALGPPGPGGVVNASNGGHYSLVWKTEKSWTGTCRQLLVAFSPTGWSGPVVAFDVRFV